MPITRNTHNRQLPTRGNSASNSIAEAEEAGAGIGVYSQEQAEEIVTDIRGAADPQEDMSALTDGGDGENGNKGDLEKLNPDCDYQPPVEDDEKGELQLLYEDQNQVPSNSKPQFVLMLAMAELNFTLEHFEPYCSYLEISKKKKKKEKSIAPKKDLYVKEVKRRNPSNQVKPQSWSLSK